MQNLGAPIGSEAQTACPFCLGVWERDLSTKQQADRELPHVLIHEACAHPSTISNPEFDSSSHGAPPTRSIRLRPTSDRRRDPPNLRPTAPHELTQARMPGAEHTLSHPPSPRPSR
ncbi:hypothetical protein HETIRDRAFT_456036 [Heterobasidion irregulare TC 32-1]|uniref:Uncharacterized protein n=1 Tax=Heterobasidion irregulare (strain TC 32-1) TaxID=747525 RepID=W4JPG8_HETIT|nr:uncharacterized protein HETIRDRAFT_456036 [Heterobasidion irregulare TC 32-1]ETW75428.1 hypothetical protein HETIRDRAFT_456036 [Heterobasidion irregulare TC 32-1]